MTNSKLHITGFYKNIIKYLLKILYISIGNSKVIFFLIKTILHQKKAAKKRNKIIKKGIQVPPLAVFGVTSQCNLKCNGCYDAVLRR
ncbi:MAG: hypothetical protein JW871_08995 [Endomicrobiales bacterium]|nr:hypothetical protein [Endomicrobiales bacterium]